MPVMGMGSTSTAGKRCRKIRRTAKQEKDDKLFKRRAPDMESNPLHPKAHKPKARPYTETPKFRRVNKAQAPRISTTSPSGHAFAIKRDDAPQTNHSVYQGFREGF